MTTLRERIDAATRRRSGLEMLVLGGDDFVDVFSSADWNRRLWLKLVLECGRYFATPKGEPFADYATMILQAPSSDKVLLFNKKPAIGDRVLVLPKKATGIHNYREIGAIGVYREYVEEGFFSMDHRYVIEVDGNRMEIDALENRLVVIEEVPEIAGQKRAGKPKGSHRALTEKPSLKMEPPAIPPELEAEAGFYESTFGYLEEAFERDNRKSIRPGTSIVKPTPIANAQYVRKPRAEPVSVQAEPERQPGKAISTQEQVRMTLHRFLCQHGFYNLIFSARLFLKDYGAAGEEILRSKHPAFYANFLKFSEVARSVARQG